MKGTTLRRSNITKEKVAMLEALQRYESGHGSGSRYKAGNKERELDALWQSFGVKTSRTEKTPQVYFITGLVSGIIIALLLTTFVSILINISTPKDDIAIPASKAAVESGKFAFVPSDDAASKKVSSSEILNEEYIVKEGDTLESIIIRFYGAFSPERVNLIKEANNMTNPNALSIGQKLIIPMNR